MDYANAISASDLTFGHDYSFTAPCDGIAYISYHMPKGHTVTDTNWNVFLINGKAIITVAPSTTGREGYYPLPGLPLKKGDTIASAGPMSAATFNIAGAFVPYKGESIE